TVIALGSRAGDELIASRLSFPAATANGTPESTAAATAESSAADTPPPRLMLATQRSPLPQLFATWLTPAITPALLPDPLHASTRTGTSVAALAMPKPVPAAV